VVLSAPTTPYGLERLNLFAVVVDRHVADVVDAALSVPGLVEGFPGPVTLIKVLRNSRHVGSLGVGLRRTRVQKGRGLRGSGPPVRLSVLTFTDRTGYRMRTLGACPVCARLHPARPPGRSPLRSHRRTCGFSKYANRRGAKSAKRVLKGFLSLLAPRHLRVFEEHKTTHPTEERRLLKVEPQERILWLNALRNLNTATPGETEQISRDTASSSADAISKSLTQQGAKSAKSRLDTLLALLALPHTRNLERTTERLGSIRSGSRTSPTSACPPAAHHLLLSGSDPGRLLPQVVWAGISVGG
jgi:hypothetical protein